MRAFAKDLDRSVIVALGAGIAAGAAWLLWTGPGFMLAGLALTVVLIGLLIKRSWLEVGALMIGAGVVPTLGYLIGGSPDPPPRTSRDALPVEYWAQSVAALFLVLGLIAFVVAATFGILNGRRRERVEREHEARRRERLDAAP